VNINKRYGVMPHCIYGAVADFHSRQLYTYTAYI